MLSIPNHSKPGLWSDRSVHLIGRNLAGCLFAALTTCGSVPSGFDSLAASHRTAVVHSDALARNSARHYRVLGTPVISSVPIADASQPFGLDAMPVAPGELQVKWRNVEAEIHSDMEILARCREQTESCSPAAQRFLSIIDEGRARNGRARIGVINRAVNLAIRPVSDFSQWGVPDHWSPPLETFSTGRGDCEDYAIAKYVALVAAGIANEDVKLILVRDLATNQDHAVVATRLEGNWILLDNRWLALVHDVETRRVIPLFVLDNDGVKQFALNKDDKNIGSLAETAPAAIPNRSERPQPKLVAEELSKRQSIDLSAFLDGLTNSVNSGNLLIERRLTTADLREYAMKTYPSTGDKSGN